MPPKASKIWMNGKLVDFADAKVHVLSHVLHYGSAVFEGIRVYAVSGKPQVFRLRDHIRRLVESARIYRMEIPWSREDLEKASVETVRANGFKACYIRPLVYRGFGEVGVNPLKSPVECAIAVWEWGAYLGAEALEKGVDVQVSSWTRIAANTLPAFSKCAANYMNAQLIKMEAIGNGFVEGIALDTEGYVSEGSGENVFLVRDGVLYTPPISSSILVGVTRATVMTLAAEAGVPVREERIPREMLYVCDEMFLTGTATEVTPVRSVDRLAVGPGKPGPVTREIQRRFLGTVTGEVPDKHGWLTPVG
ncbi:MAG: branched-chain amino acid transaminase [Planctomycetales bacterium]|nr:branched-chain amino acid transaminase [Planctomycetales bacterium]